MNVTSFRYLIDFVAKRADAYLSPIGAINQHFAVEENSTRVCVIALPHISMAVLTPRVVCRCIHCLMADWPHFFMADIMSMVDNRLWLMAVHD